MGRLALRGALPAATAVAVFIFFFANGVPAALLACAIASASVYVAVVNARRPRILAFAATACVVVAGLSDLLAGESAPTTTTAILAALALLVFASLWPPRADLRMLQRRLGNDRFKSD